MLVQLAVRNLAVVEAAEVAFGAGLNVITGETGAGKSVLMGALHLVLGERADRSMIRTGATEASVSAVYVLPETTEVDALLREAEVPECEDGTLILRRVIAANGSGRIRVNDAPATAGLLRQLAPFLTDIHGPADNLSLLDGAFQLRLLTAYADGAPELQAYTEAWQALRALHRELEELTGDPERQVEEIERLTYEVDELERIRPTEADGEELVQQHATVANAEEILTLGNALAAQLTDGENSLSEQVIAVGQTVRELTRLLPEAAEWGEELEMIYAQVQELSRTIAGRLSQVEADPEALERLEARMTQIQRLKRLYGPSLDEVLAHWKAAQERLEKLRAMDGDVAALKARIAEAEATVREAGERLRAKRMAAVPKLSKAITEALRSLGFLQASFPIELRPCEPSASGMDEAVFLFEPNPGEAPRPLAAIASSGEIARVMLAVKVILARHDATPTLVFDEIDANIGGETGRKVGIMLQRLARTTQVICITHQPQAAVYGEHHFCVRKAVEEGRTLTTIEPLSPEERIDEVARMLGGVGFTSVTREHAEAMLLSAAAADDLFSGE